MQYVKLPIRVLQNVSDVALTHHLAYLGSIILVPCLGTNNY